MAEKGLSLVRQAEALADKKGIPMVDAMMQLEDQLRVKRDVETSKSQPERQAAEKGATSKMVEGVKVTEYPRVKGGGGGGDSDTREMQLGSELDPKAMMRRTGRYSSFAKGGAVKSASSRADGIAQRGKTRGKMVMCGGGMTRGKK